MFDFVAQSQALRCPSSVRIVGPFSSSPVMTMLPVTLESPHVHPLHGLPMNATEPLTLSGSKEKRSVAATSSLFLVAEVNT